MKDNILINRWQKAYEACNHQPAPNIVYNHGWYRIDNIYGTPFRLWKLQRITEALEERAGIMPLPLGGLPLTKQRGEV